MNYNDTPRLSGVTSPWNSLSISKKQEEVSVESEIQFTSPESVVPRNPSHWPVWLQESKATEASAHSEERSSVALCMLGRLGSGQRPFLGL